MPQGGCIDRGRAVPFSFNGRPLSGFQGDTLASALLANGISLVARSFKYHRPRGILSAGEEEPCALVEIGTGARRVPTSRAPLVPLTAGLVAASQNCWPRVGFDLGRAIDFSHGLWPAGFYNKTFKWPAWGVWENLVRKTAGMGRPLTRRDPDHYEHVNVHCDLLVCGGGAAGLMAALSAGRSGARVIVADQDTACGGALNWERARIDGQDGADWVRDIVRQLNGLGNVMLLPRTTVTGVYDHNVTTLLQRAGDEAWRECQWTVRPRRILLATGAIEQTLIFPDNDRPGIMLAGAVRHYLNRYAVAAGERPIVVTNNDTAYQTVLDLARRNIAVAAVVDSRGGVDPALRQKLSALGTELIGNARISATRGSRGLRAVSIERLDGTRLGRRECDLLAVSGGWSPRLHLLAHARGSLRFDPVSQSFLPRTLPPGFAVAGAAAGTHDLAATLEEALRCAAELSRALGFTPAPVTVPRVDEEPVASAAVTPQPLDLHELRQWIDLAHDVTLGDAKLAVTEGFDAVEHFKRYTTTGMSVDQGKSGNLNAFIVLGELTGKTPAEVGTTTFRPPYTPVTLGAVVGRELGEFYAPRRYLPAHTAHLAMNARFEDYGWQRPECYPQGDEALQDAVMREVRAVRTQAGIFDNSPIGKIEVMGPDAADFLNRIYANDMSSLQPGRARYGLMLNENGVIIDDGVLLRLDENRFVAHATSAAAGRIAAMLEEWLQCEWSGLEVIVADMTTQWANFTVAGPRARDVLTAAGTDIDVSAEALPHMAAAAGRVAGFGARIVRVSYSGELSFEVNVAASRALPLWQRLLDAGQASGITPVGVEALMVLRTEKGYLHVGTDTDISTTPDDVGWGRAVRRKNTDYVGRRSLLRPANEAADRMQLVGLQALEAGRVMRPGGHLLFGAGRRAPARTDGWITSACYSPTLECYIALAMLRGGRSRRGDVVTVCDGQRRYPARVAEPAFYDPENRRLQA